MCFNIPFHLFLLYFLVEIFGMNDADFHKVNAKQKLRDSFCCSLYGSCNVSFIITTTAVECVEFFYLLVLSMRQYNKAHAYWTHPVGRERYRSLSWILDSLNMTLASKFCWLYESSTGETNKSGLEKTKAQIFQNLLLTDQKK